MNSRNDFGILAMIIQGMFHIYHSRPCPLSSLASRYALLV
jgi:hypothetical protein